MAEKASLSALASAIADCRDTCRREPTTALLSERDFACLASNLSFSARVTFLWEHALVVSSSRVVDGTVWLYNGRDLLGRLCLYCVHSVVI